MPIQRLVLILVVFASQLVMAADEITRIELERVYTDWRAALMARSLQAWQRSTSAYRQMMTRNVVISQGRPFPQALFDLPLKPPSVLGLKLVEVEAVGETAHLVYFGKIDLGVEEQTANLPENLMVLKFYKEPGGWKFDTTKYINLGSDEAARDELRRGGAEFLNSPPFNPPGKAPAVPQPCRKPEMVAALRIHAIGYDVSAQMNGFSLEPVADDAMQQLIIGGLSMGNNMLHLDIKQLPLSAEPGATRHLEVQAVIGTDDPNKPSVRVFRWEPPSHPADPSKDLNVVVDIRTMKGV